MCPEERCHPLQQIAWIPAVVVRKADDVRAGVAQADVASVAVAELRPQVEDREGALCTGDDLDEAVVAVLVDDDQAEAAERLRIERSQERFRLVRAVDGGENEVDCRCDGYETPGMRFSGNSA